MGDGWDAIDAARTAWDRSAEPGNRAADLWRRAFATPAEPLEGLTIGWRGSERATTWILGIADRCETYREDLEGGAELEELADLVADHAAGDPAVGEALGILAELPAWAALEPLEVAPPVGEVTPERVVRERLAELARELARTYLGGMRDAD